MIELAAVILLSAFVVLFASMLLYAFARGVIWWRNRKPPEVYVDRVPMYEYSDRERR